MNRIHRIVVGLAILASACASQAATLLYQNNTQMDVGASLYYPAVIKDSATLTHTAGLKITISAWELRYMQPSTVTIQLVNASTLAVIDFISLTSLYSTEHTYVWNTSGRTTPYFIRIKATCMQTLGMNYTHTLNKTFMVETRP